MWGRGSIFCALLLFQGEFFLCAVKYNRIRRMRSVFLQETRLRRQRSSPGEKCKPRTGELEGQSGYIFSTLRVWAVRKMRVVRQAQTAASYVIDNAIVRKWKSSL